MIQGDYIFSLFLSILMAPFPGEPGLASFIGAKDDGSGGDNWRHSNRHHQQTQRPTFYGPHALPLVRPTVSKH